MVFDEVLATTGTVDVACVSLGIVIISGGSSPGTVVDGVVAIGVELTDACGPGEVNN